VELVAGDLSDELLLYIERSVDQSPNVKHEYHSWAGQY
jgi:hypothetical protein